MEFLWSPQNLCGVHTEYIGESNDLEKMPILTIKDKSEIPAILRKATIEEMLDEEALTLIADQQSTPNTIIEEVPTLSNDSEDSDEELLKVAILELDEPEEDKMIIAYIKGDLLSAFLKGRIPCSPKNMIILNMTMLSSGIQQISTLIRSARYTFGQDI
jgi:hypothetical protein